MRAMEQRLSECVRAVEIHLSSETHLEKVFKRIEKNQDAFQQRVTQQLQELKKEQEELHDGWKTLTPTCRNDWTRLSPQRMSNELP